MSELMPIMRRALPIVLFLCLSQISANAAGENTIPYANHFENLTLGQDIDLEPGWQREQNSTRAKIKKYPRSRIKTPHVPDGLHTNVLDVDGSVSVTFESYVTDEGDENRDIYGDPVTNIYMDMLVMPEASSSEEYMVATFGKTHGDIPQFAAYVNTNGHLVVRHSYVNWVTFMHNMVWSTNTSVALNPGDWFRLSIQAAYRSSPDCREPFFQVQVNGGAPLQWTLGYTSPAAPTGPPPSGTWLMAGNAAWHANVWRYGCVRKLLFRGKVVVDDLLITNEPPPSVDLGDPRISVDPDELDVEIERDDTCAENIFIRNRGGADLTFNISPVPDPTGGPQKLWTITTEDTASHVTTDPSGYVYVAGTTKKDFDGQTNTNPNCCDFFLTKYDSDGNKIWSRIWGSTDGESCYGNGAIACDTQGNIYVAGDTYGSWDGQSNAGNCDLCLTKHDSNGNRLWTRIWGSGGYDWMYGEIKTDDQGNVYMIGTGNWAAYLLVTKFNSGGTVVWQKTWNHSDDSRGQGIAIDSSSNVYFIVSENGPQDGMWLTKYDKNGNELWAETWASSGSDEAVSLVTDQDDNVFVVGYTEGGFDGENPSGGSDVFLTKFSASGSRLWSRMWGSVTDELVTGMDMDSAGNIYIVGRSRGSVDEEPASGLYDMFMSRVTTDGVRQWNRLWGSSGDDIFCDVSPVGNDMCYVTGMAGGAMDGQQGPALLSKLYCGGSTNWVSAVPDSGLVASGGVVQITVTFDATSFFIDRVGALLEITSNDPSLPVTQVPVRMSVIRPATDVAVTKQVDIPVALPAENTSFTITVTNLGSATATDIAVLDEMVLPATVTLDSWSADAGLYDSTSGVWSIGTVQADEGANLTLTLSVADVPKASVIANSVIHSPNPMVLERFGNSAVGVGESVLAIAGYMATTADATYSGAVYLFDWDGNFLATIHNPAPERSCQFGKAMAAVDSSVLAVGAGVADVGAVAGAGKVYLFDLDGELLVTIPHPFPVEYDCFGSVVAGVGSDMLVVGVPRADTDPVIIKSIGEAYLFTASGELVAAVSNPTPENNDYFGQALAAVGTDMFAVGAYGDDDESGVSHSGAVYLYNLSGDLIRTYYDPATNYWGHFGQAVVGLGTNKFVVGAPGARVGGTNNIGVVYIFDTDGQLLTAISNPAPATQRYFGRRLAVLGEDRILVGVQPGATAVQYLLETNGTLLVTISIPNYYSGNESDVYTCALDATRFIFGDTEKTVSGVYQAGEMVLYDIEEGGRILNRATLQTLEEQTDLVASNNSSAAEFAIRAQREYELIIQTEGSGTVNQAAGWYTNGHLVGLTATPASNWYFDSWAGEVAAGSESSNSITLVMDRPRNVTGRFTDDTDSDGLRDEWEYACFGDLEQTGDDDTDGDGLKNIQELSIGTNPQVTDTDDDGWGDAEELLQYGTDPTNADTDDDGIIDSHEYVAGSDPQNGRWVYAISKIARSAQLSNLLWWSSVPRRCYRVDRATNSLDGFSCIASNIVATPPANVHTTAPAHEAAIEFYRVWVQLDRDSDGIPDHEE